MQLHEELLGELHRAVPCSEYTAQQDAPAAVQPGPANAPAREHRRWKSLDAVPEGKDGVLWLHDVAGVAAEPQTAAEVARIFLKRVGRGEKKGGDGDALC